MARFEKTLGNLLAIRKNLPTGAQVKRTVADPAEEALAKNLIAILRNEDSRAVRIALLIDRLITKYGGRSV